jgi:formiminotetrahydrofolate cyclodeaminase
MAYASLKSAQYNVLENIRKMKDKAFAESCRNEVTDLVGRGQDLLQQVDALVTQIP